MSGDARSRLHKITYRRFDRRNLQMRILSNNSIPFCWRRLTQNLRALLIPICSLVTLATATLLMTACIGVIAQSNSQSDPELDALNDHVMALLKQGKFPEAIPLVEQGVITAQKKFGENDPRYATALSPLALLYTYLTRYAEAEDLFKRAL